MISDRQLVNDCIKLNKLAQKELYDKYAPAMRALCARYAADKDEIKDLLQEGFIKVFLNLKKFQFQGSLEGWIKRIMINTAINHYHKKKRQQEVVYSDQFTSGEILQEHGEEESFSSFPNEEELTEADLMDALDILKPELRMVFNLFFMEDYSHKEISSLIGIEENTSRSRLFRARHQVQKYLAELLSEDKEGRNNLRKLK